MKPTLVVLAAGMGSRYGGLKQVDPVGPSGEAILDYSVFDAVRAGFGKVVFVIRRDFEAAFREKVGRKYEGLVAVDYCFQDLDDLPAPYAVPEGRVKPWGTAHATRAVRRAVNEPFAVINADDFYGRDAMARLAAALSRPCEVAAPSRPCEVAAPSRPCEGSAPSRPCEGSAPSRPCEVEGSRQATEDAARLHLFMVGYRLDRTLSENGSVARGICDVSPDGFLKGVTEMTKLVRAGDAAENREDGAPPVRVPLDARVSMNCWGFTPRLFDELETRFAKFLSAHGTETKGEWYIPFVVDELIREGKADCRVLPTDSAWFGVTYREDKPSVVAEIAKLVTAGEYPANLLA